MIEAHIHDFQVIFLSSIIWRFPEIGVPLKSSISRGFSITIHFGVPLFLDLPDIPTNSHSMFRFLLGVVARHVLNPRVLLLGELPSWTEPLAAPGHRANAGC